MFDDNYKQIGEFLLMHAYSLSDGGDIEWTPCPFKACLIYYFTHSGKIEKIKAGKVSEHPKNITSSEFAFHLPREKDFINRVVCNGVDTIKQMIQTAEINIQFTPYIATRSTFFTTFDLLEQDRTQLKLLSYKERRNLVDVSHLFYPLIGQSVL